VHRLHRAGVARHVAGGGRILGVERHAVFQAAQNTLKYPRVRMVPRGGIQITQ